MTTLKLTPQIIAAAIDGYEAQKIRIDSTLAELRAMLSGGSAKPAAAKPEPQKLKRRKMSAKGRQAISEATKNRWAAFHAAKQAAASGEGTPENANLKKSATKKTAAKKSAPAKKAATKKTAPAAAMAATETEGQ